LFSVLLHMDMNSYTLHTQKRTLLHSWTLDVMDGNTTHQDAWMLPSFTHLLCCTTHTKFWNPPMAQHPSWARASLLPWLHDQTQMHHALVGLLSTIDRPNAKTPMWQHTTLTRDRYRCPQRDLNSQSQQANGSRPMPYTAWPLGLANIIKYCMYSHGSVDWGTALQTGRPRVQFPMVSLEYFIDIILLAALWPWGLLSL
jgi:hypothetical protein